MNFGRRRIPNTSAGSTLGHGALIQARTEVGGPGGRPPPRKHNDGSWCQVSAARRRRKPGNSSGSRKRQRIAVHLAVLCIVAVAGGFGNAVASNAKHCTGSMHLPATETKVGEDMVTIRINGTNWGEAHPENIKKLLENVAWHMTRHFREPIYATIDVMNHHSGPQILLRIPGQTTYTVLLDTTDRYWAQYSYQFAHEFCHLISNYEQRFDTPNQWIDETICETASLFTLRSMGETWKETPPYASWKEFAVHLTAYASAQAGKVKMEATDSTSWEEWLRRHEDKSREDPYDREGNRAIALRLLPLFEQHPEGWNAVRNLPATKGRIGQYLKEWKKQVQPCEQMFVTKIATRLGLAP